jgi:RND superfamily putative drug exporter
VVRLVRVRPVALLLAVACIGGLTWLALPVQHISVGLPLVRALPPDSEAARAADAATAGFAPGIVAPSLVVVQGANVGVRPDALLALEGLLQKEANVAGVLGPKEDATLSAQAGRPVKLFVAAARETAQYVVILNEDPLDAKAVDAVGRLQDRLPGLLRQAGLDNATATVAGDTAAVAAVVHQSERDLAAILLAALLVNLIILVVVLRAVIAPLLLLGCTVLSVAATLGLTVWLFQVKLGHPGLTFFVPLAAGVLLVALGSDYNLFAVGHIWQEARRRSLREAMLVALPRSSSAITTAGLALAASLGTLGLVPLRQFDELAFALAVGILLDTYVVRTLLVPALLTVVGTAAGWPGSRLRASADVGDGDAAGPGTLPPARAASRS